MANFGVKTIILLLAICIYTGAVSVEYDECPDIESPSVWIDNAPDCKANSSYCHHFGLDYVCSANITDEENSCFGGTKVKCTHPPATPLASPLPVNTLKLITYNVWELTYLVSQIGQRERTCRILPWIFERHPDVDVIAFQEVFMGGCVVNVNNSLTLRDILEEYGFIHYTETVGLSLALLPGTSASEKRNSTAESGGVFIASRWPIVQEKETVFDHYDATTSDILSAKGCMYALVRKTVGGASKDFHIFGTHMQSTENPDSPGIRVLQAEQIFDFMQGLDIPINEPVIYTGDLNGDLIHNEENARAIMDALHSTKPSLTGPIIVTYDRNSNDNLAPSTGKNQYIDYILTSNDHQQPVSAITEVLRPRGEAPVEVCREFRLFEFFMYPHSPNCGETRTISDLSDHYPVVGVIEYSMDGIEMTTQAPAIRTTSGGSSPATGAMLTVVMTSLTVLISSQIMF